jgi:hypothetical protein
MLLGTIPRGEGFFLRVDIVRSVRFVCSQIVFNFLE